MANESALLELAEKNLSRERFWFHYQTIEYYVFTFLGWLCALCVPFILAVMLYLPVESLKQVNIWVIVISGVALILQVIPRMMHWKERAAYHRDNKAVLEKTIAKFKDGRIGLDELEEVVEFYAQAVSKELHP